MKHLIPVTVAAACAVAIGGCRKQRTEQMDVGGNAAAAQLRPGVAGNAWVRYGDPVSLAAGEVIPVSAVLADPAAYEGREIVLEGKAAEVCPKKGCWVRIGDEGVGAGVVGAERSVFVKLTCPSDAGFIVPPDSAGQVIRVSGTVVLEEMDEATARHLAEDAGASAEEVATIVGPQQSLSVQAPGVLIRQDRG